MIRIFSLVAATLFLFACQSEDLPATAEEERPEAVEATVDLEIGVADGEEEYLFGRIGGVAVSPGGHVVVADLQAHELRAYDREGTYLFTIGGHGEGPGELNRPCCPAFGPDGLLWVRDDQNRRYNAYDLTDSGASPHDNIRMDHTHFGLLAAITFDEDGHLIDVGGRQPTEDDESNRGRFHRSMDSETVREVMIPAAPEGRIPIYEAPIEGGIMFVPQPMGARELNAHSPTGEWAFTITDRYEVTWFNAAGDTLRVISQDMAGPELSPDEQERAQQQLQQQADRIDARVSEFPFGVPDRKPPLAGIFFDSDGRLWVQRSVPDGAPNEADVYDRDGNLVQVVQWPSGISLTLGHLTEDTLYGIRQGGGDAFPQVVRLRY